MSYGHIKQIFARMIRKTEIAATHNKHVVLYEYSRIQ